MNTKELEKEPIGAVIKKADSAFSNIVRKTPHGSFNRVEWQFLNLLSKKERVSKKEVFKFLVFFISDKETDLLIRKFEERGLIISLDKEVLITDKGKDAFSEAYKAQETIIGKAMRGINDSDYSITIRTIRTIIENLDEYLPENS